MPRSLFDVRATDPNPRRTASWVLQVALALVFASAGIGKLVGAEHVLSLLAPLGTGGGLRIAVGCAELAAAPLLLWPRTASATALVLTVLMAAAAAVLASLGEPVLAPLIAGGFCLVLAALRWPQRRR